MSVTSAVAIEIEVRFAETDMMQVVHHAAYLPWLEMGRIAYMQACKAPYPEIARTHNFSVVEVSLEIRKPLVFGDKVQVLTSLEKISSRKLSFSYQLRDPLSDLSVASGITAHVCVDLEGRAARIPAELAAKLKTTELT